LITLFKNKLKIATNKKLEVSKIYLSAMTTFLINNLRPLRVVTLPLKKSRNYKLKKTKYSIIQVTKIKMKKMIMKMVASAYLDS
jgi:hypothetical protein